MAGVVKVLKGSSGEASKKAADAFCQLQSSYGNISLGRDALVQELFHNGYC